LCIAGLQKFGVDNTTIRRKAFRILDDSLDNFSSSNINSNNEDSQRQIRLAEMIEGVIEALALCLVSDRINDTEKDQFRALILKIADMESDGNKKD